MSGLDALLAGHRPPGVYTWNATSAVDDVRRTVEQAGAVFAYVDGWNHQSKAEFLVAVGDALAFPDWYGANLDAFADCLNDHPRGSTVLLWDGWATMARAEPRAFADILEIAAERAYLPGGDVEVGGAAPFSLLLRGPGPEIPAVVLDA